MERRKNFSILMGVLLATAVLFGAGVWAWSAKARSVALTQATEAFEEAAAASRKSVDSYFDGATAKARAYANRLSEIDSTAPAAREKVLELTKRTLENDSDIWASWFLYEPEAFDGRDREFAGGNEKDVFDATGRMAGKYIRKSGAIRWTPYPANDENGEDVEWYREAREKNREGVFDLHFKFDFDPALLFSSRWSRQIPDPEPYAILGVLLKQEGKTLGAAGLEVSLRSLSGALAALPDTVADAQAILVNDEGYVVAADRSWNVGKSVDNLYMPGLEDEIDIVAASFPKYAVRSGVTQGGTVFFCERLPIDVRGGLTLALFVSSKSLYGKIDQPVIGILAVGYTLLLLSALTIWLVGRKKNPAPPVEAVPQPPTLSPVDAERFASLSRQRMICRLLAVLFFIPSLLAMTGPEKRFKEAEQEGNVAQAEEAVGKMWLAAIVALFVGVPLVFFHFTAF